ncbi:MULTISPECIES: sigma-70 family RNA polymerase sigma factor [Prevotellaceae]|jgi:RNA polymerase primary sigma factor|uniref:sigma-70 family RNA polymerase sigma factor n=1 Tax=Prevotellaceae TaxID=171552 RepID=UPI001C3928FD|nr:RNA polymerase sigma factor RpoD/SigA [Segatella copri]MBV3402379.1 RNA polymerase sigma factor RpoD/SigA [Segatella copri]MBW0050138.1 RNA polymerase sigma factor RpoD/SigA [Segatella copri]MCW4117764.1 RNA polymerase sigma factor RpoD/SigA [Segatella copri]MDY5672380.1 RNA polymerase sigma factor RpoD/SigA [Prevotella sp.]
MRQLKIQKSITNRNSEALDKYLVEIGRAPMISIDEEIELAQIIRKGGRAGERAKNRLVEANLRFVVSVAKQYQHQGLTLTDLIDEGNIGLIKAAERFDETRGFKFISYAVWWVRQSILQAIAEQSRIVRLPLNQVGSLNKVNQEINKFEQENLRKPSVQEISDRTGVDEDKIAQSMMASGHHVSIDAPFGSDDDDNAMVDVMSSGDDSRTDKGVDHESMAQELRAVLDKVLKERERKILCACYGIGETEKGLEEIGDKMGLTRERVRQIREKSITKLRESGNIKILAKYLG